MRGIYIQRVCGPGDTGCTAVVDRDEFFFLAPRACGYLAAGPHPDPEKGYREPLCQKHLDLLESEEATPATGGPSNEQRP